jgi:hypothetical protein
MGVPRLIVGSLSAGILCDRFGFGPVFTVVTAVFVTTTALVWWGLPRDDTVVAGFPFSNLALNRPIRTVATFRTQYAVAVTLVRTWVPIFAGVSAATGGLAYGGLAVSLTVVAEMFTNMPSQPTMGRLSDRYGLAAFVACGGSATSSGARGASPPPSWEDGSRLGSAWSGCSTSAGRTRSRAWEPPRDPRRPVRAEGALGVVNRRRHR